LDSVQQKKLVGMTAVSFMALALAGCGSAANQPAPSPQKTSVTTNPVNGGTLVIGQGTKYNDEFLPYLDATIYTANIDTVAYDPLLTVDKNLNFQPDLAKSWAWSADKKTITMHLQPNAEWSDGQPITSDDVLFAMNYLGSKDYIATLQGQYSTFVSQVIGADKLGAGTATSFADVGGFTKIDDKTFEIHIKQADAAVLYSMLAAITPVPAHILKKYPIKTWTNLSENKQPTVVSGPYMFVKVDGQASVEMAANPHYWRGKPHIANITFKTVNPDVAPGMLANGSLGFMMNGLKPTDAIKLQQSSDIKVETVPTNGFDFLGMKLYQPQFKDVRVRQAFEYALDRKTMIQGIEKGLAVPINGPIPAVDWAAATTKDGMNPYDYNPDKANKLLDAAGWTKAADGWRVDPSTGKKANLTLSYGSGDPTLQSEAVAIRQYLGAVGVQVTLNAPVDFNTLVSQMLSDSNKKLEFYLGPWQLGTDPDPRGIWQSTSALNIERWKDPKSDKLIDATWNAAAFDMTVRKQALVQWQLFANQQLPYIFLWSPDYVWAHTTKLHVPAADWTPAGPLNIQDWWLSS